jgi:DNA (cytosine-5)-methyltransferase 1
MDQAVRRPTISAVDLFCGVGGLTHGLLRAGITVKAGVDVDPACRYPFERNNSAMFMEKDVGDLGADDIAQHLEGSGDYSLLAGCAPCQPFSTYSRSGRSKKRDQDWRLVLKFGRLVEALQPDYVTMENVPQLQAHSVFQDFINSLAGYDILCRRVDCIRLGVPQSRQRLVLIAAKRGTLPEDLPSISGKPRTVRQVIGDLPKLAAGQQDAADPLHAAAALSPLNLRRIKSSRPGGTWRDWDEDLRAACHVKATGATFPSVYGRMEWDSPAPTITTQCFGYGNGRFGHPEQDRAISLREAAMLQTFPSNYELIEPGEKVRFNHLGRLIGNAVPVRLGEVIGDLVLDHARNLTSSSL